MKKIVYAALIVVAALAVVLVMSSSPPNYFSEDAPVMYFFSASCHWCQEQKPILKELGSEGYLVKPMDVGGNNGYWEEYQIEGTPTFIGPDGERLVGYQSKEILKEFLDRY